MKRSKLFCLAAVLLFMGFSASAQKFGKTPEDSVECVKNISLYQTFYQQKNYKDCYEPWKNLLTLCPQFSKNIFIRGTVILEYMIEKETDAVKKKGYINELLNLYDLRTVYYQEASQNRGYKALAMKSYCPDSVAVYYTMLNEVVKEMGVESEPSFVYYLFVSTYEYVAAGKGDLALVIENYDKATTLLAQIEKKNPKEKEMIDQYLSSMESAFAPLATCDQLIEIYTKKFEESPNDVELLKKITAMLDRKKCTNAAVFFKATEKLHQLEPTPRTALLMGRMSYEKDQSAKAIEYLKEAAEKAETPDDKYDAYMLLAYAYGKQSQYAAARSAAYKALELKPNDGSPYLFVAQLYARSAGSCGSGPVYGRVAYWAAADKCAKAKAIDQSKENVDAANRLMNAYAGQFPSKGEAFMEGLDDGQSYTVGCWIGETTIVRTRK